MTQEVTMRKLRHSDTDLSNGYNFNQESLILRQFEVLDTPLDVRQRTFSDTDTLRTSGFIRNHTEEYFIGFTSNINKPFNLLSTKIEWFGNAYHTIYNDTFSDYDDAKTSQITGYVREQFNRKTIYLGDDLNPTVMTGSFEDDGFVPEYWYAYLDESSQPTITAPLAPKSGCSHGD